MSFMGSHQEVSQSLLKTMSFCHEKAILSSNEMKGYNQRSCWGSSHHSPLFFPFCQCFNFCNREQSWLLYLQILHCFTCAYMSTMVSIILLLQWFPITVRKILKFSLELTGSDMLFSYCSPTHLLLPSSLSSCQNFNISRNHALGSWCLLISILF